MLKIPVFMSTTSALVRGKSEHKRLRSVQHMALKARIHPTSRKLTPGYTTAVLISICLGERHTLGTSSWKAEVGPRRCAAEKEHPFGSQPGRMKIHA